MIYCERSTSIYTLLRSETRTKIFTEKRRKHKVKERDERNRKIGTEGENDRRDDHMGSPSVCNQEQRGSDRNKVNHKDWEWKGRTTIWS